MTTAARVLITIGEAARMLDCPASHVLELARAGRLHRLLESQGFSISEAARQAGMQKQAAWLIVTGRNANPGVETVRRLVEAIGATMGELFADEE